MCEAAAIVAVILTVVSTVVSTNQANKAADDQADAIAAQATTNRAALVERASEITDKAEIEKFERQKQTQREIASTRVAQSEAGIGGNLGKRTLMAALIDGGQDVALIEKQEKTLHSQINRQVDAVSAGAALNTAGLRWTSPLAATVKTASAGFGAYTGAGGKFGKG